MFMLEPVEMCYKYIINEVKRCFSSSASKKKSKLEERNFSCVFHPHSDTDANTREGNDLAFGGIETVEITHIWTAKVFLGSLKLSGNVKL